jgi:hypothetical protein
MKKKIIIATLISVLSILLILFVISLVSYFSLPKDTSYLNVKIGVAKINEDVIWGNGTLNFSYGNDDETTRYMKYLSRVVKTVKYDSVDNSLSDAQCVEFDFRSVDNTEKKYVFAYDFYTKKLYGLNIEIHKVLIANDFSQILLCI